ncbi:MAG: hypothetical protein JWM80_6428 [Cyanobacteria bacterium RYN_339]|nr:hypothetical protein [Cyanobacteria bacterium RYN_339]
MLRSTPVRLLIAVALIGLAAYGLHALGLSAQLDRAVLARLIAPLGPWGPLAFGAVFALWVFVALPSAAMNLAGGALFGLALGFVVNWLGCALGACLGFFMARNLGREAIAHRLTGRLQDVDQLLGRHGFTTLLLIRLSSIFPFGALSYAAGISAIRARDFVAATLIGMLPSSLLWTYLGVNLVDFQPRGVALAFAALALLLGVAVIARRRLLGSSAAGDP